MKYIEHIKLILGLFLLSIPIITGLLYFYHLPDVNQLGLFQSTTEGALIDRKGDVSSNTLIFVSACGFIGAYLLNLVKK